MKKVILFATLLAGTAAYGQVTIPRSAFPYTGTYIETEEDTSSGGFAIAAGGANKTWDYTGLSAGIKSKYKFVNSNWQMGNENFPGANMAKYNELSSDTSVDFLNVSSTEMSWMGNYSVFNGETQITKFKLKQLSFPMTTTTNFTSSDSVMLPAEALGLDPDGAGPFPSIDSTRVSIKATNYASVIGYGTLKTPLGNFASLLQESQTITQPKVYYYALGKWRVASPTIAALLGMDGLQGDTTITHAFYTNDSRVQYTLLTYEFQPGETQMSNPEYASKMAEVSKTTNTSKTTVSLYPSPAGAQLSYNFEGAENATRADITDLNGRVVKTLALDKNNRVIGVNELSSGIYYINFRNNFGQVITAGKWVKE